MDSGSSGELFDLRRGNDYLILKAEENSLIFILEVDGEYYTLEIPVPVITDGAYESMLSIWMLVGFSVDSTEGEHKNSLFLNENYLVTSFAVKIDSFEYEVFVVGKYLQGFIYEF